MKLGSRLIQRVLQLPPPATRNLVVEHDLRVPMRDGAELLADRWTPRGGGDGLPTALLRCPYGRTGVIATALARPLAERGFQVVIVSTRGTFGSGGAFDPLRCERADGLDTLEWLVGRPWCGQSVVLAGGSYLGFAQWAVADALPPQVKAMIPAVSESAFTLEFLRGEAFGLEATFSWGVQVDGQQERGARLRQFREAGRRRRALSTLPLVGADLAAIGRRSEYFQNTLAYDAESDFWSVLDHSGRVADIAVPVSTVGGWYDIFLPGQLRDFKALQAAGRAAARLTVGPWAHVSMGVTRTGVGETLEFGLAYATGGKPPERAAVRLFVMGEEAWRDFAAWPPPGYQPRRLHLQAGGALGTGVPAEAEPDRYRYDPADPTPAVGGVRMAVGEKSGRVDNAKLEARSDVLTYTTEPLKQDTEVIGEVRAEIWLRSDRAGADVFVRLCDVDERGRSTNVCDGLITVVGTGTGTDAAPEAGAGGPSRADLALWPTAYRFKRGHRIRVQVSSGAFPRYNRNPGTAEPRATAATLQAAVQEVFHDPAHPSAVILPVQAALRDLP